MDTTRGPADQSAENKPDSRSDLIEQARRRADLTTSVVEATMLRDLVDTLTSEREATDQILREETALLRHKYRGAMSAKGRAQQELDVAEAALAAERDRADRAEALLAEVSEAVRANASATAQKIVEILAIKATA